MRLLALVLAAGNAAAADYGLGLSAKSDNGLLYLPIDVSPRFRIEPHVRYSTEDVAAVQSVPGVPTVSAGDTETLEIGAGAFGLSMSKESTRIYYGARISYLDVKIINTLSAGGTSRRIEETSYGYRIAPTLGFEYLFNRHFTLGGEVAYYYVRLDDDQKFGTGHSKVESDGNGTESFLILRYFF